MIYHAWGCTLSKALDLLGGRMEQGIYFIYVPVLLDAPCNCSHFCFSFFGAPFMSGCLVWKQSLFNNSAHHKLIHRFACFVFATSKSNNNNHYYCYSYWYWYSYYYCYYYYYYYYCCCYYYTLLATPSAPFAVFWCIQEFPVRPLFGLKSTIQKSRPK